MARDYSEYLAINVLNEQQVVSYRTLSRALKVHVNLAKQMLYDFHRKQNAKKPSSVHATYLITGTRVAQSTSKTNGIHSQDGEDTVMRSSPPIPGSSPAKQTGDSGDNDDIPIRTVLLVREEHLEKAKATFKHISGIHVYSLQPGSLSDIQVLSDCNRRIVSLYAAEDPLVAWKQYGTIQDPNVKRRTQGQRPPPPVAPPLAKSAVSTKPTATAGKPVALERQASRASDASISSAKATPEPNDTANAKKSAASKPPATKRQSSDIFKSFAKGGSKAKKETPDTSAAPSPALVPVADQPMGGMSDDDGDDAVEDAEVEVRAGTGKLRKDRQAELEAMMDAEDDPMDDTAESGIDSQTEPVTKAQAEATEEPAETMVVENGRRRGRRRVMKKKTVKDEEGYLVTKEEAVWESFSEDEPAPKKAKMASAPAVAKGGAAAKKASKPGQGNIMSFFGKK
ncbi:hypothetical protein B0A48_04828 [Cryoendolithus antarcticus]|uniref:DNA polymerase delta subunit 3 n=1 Tax=Cryoendolithus antarcticus TaxID=1507870 RepID=A0A1V8TDH2_9PEZI|nr:hypothetical protein B0A48_04828 [Cryoendolithus antarcticus]